MVRRVDSKLERISGRLAIRLHSSEASSSSGWFSGSSSNARGRKCLSRVSRIEISGATSVTEIQTDTAVSRTFISKWQLFNISHATLRPFAPQVDEPPREFVCPNRAVQGFSSKILSVSHESALGCPSIHLCRVRGADSTATLVPSLVDNKIAPHHT